MDGQLSFATIDYAGKKTRTKRDVFLAEMAAGSVVVSSESSDRAALSEMERWQWIIVRESRSICQYYEEYPP
jgi:hypothetical protein